MLSASGGVRTLQVSATELVNTRRKESSNLICSDISSLSFLLLGMLDHIEKLGLRAQGIRVSSSGLCSIAHMASWREPLPKDSDRAWERCLSPNLALKTHWCLIWATGRAVPIRPGGGLVFDGLHAASPLSRTIIHGAIELTSLDRCLPI